MTERNSFDDLFKKRLEEHESSVPEGLFERMMREREERSVEENPNIDLSNRLNEYSSAVPDNMFERIMTERERRKPAAIWWQSPKGKWGLVAGIFLLSAILIGNYWQNNQQKTSETGNNKQNKVEPSQTTEQNPIKKEDIVLFKNNTIIQPKKVKELITKLTTNNAPIKAVSNSTIITSNLEHQNLITSSTTQNTIFDPSQQEGNPMFVLPENQRVVSAVVQPIAVLNTEGVPASPLSHEKLVKDIPCLTPGGDGCPTFTIRKNRGFTFYVDAYGAPEYAFRKLNALTDEFTTYRNTRDTVERTHFAASAGTRASFVFKNGLALRGGIVYARNNEILRKDSSTLRLISVTISQLTGDTIAWNYEGGIIRQTRSNYMQTLDFTIQAGYEMPISDRLKIAFNGGVNINALTQIKATVLDKDYQLLTTTTSNTIYNKSVGTSLVGSIGGYYELNDRFELMIEPHFRYYLKPISKNPDYVLRQSYSNAGLIMGIRFKIR